MTFVHVGSLSQTLSGIGVKLTKFGERIELSPELAESCAQEGGLICIPAEDFDAIFNGPDDVALLKKYASVQTHASAPPEFLEKKQSALARLHEIRYGGE